MIIDDIMTDKIMAHGLGFRQPHLEGNQRLHVWHPQQPRRASLEHSTIHNHRFDFVSRVLVGTQVNHCLDMQRHDAGDFVLYLHEGKPSAHGGRPWTPDGRAFFSIMKSRI